MFERPRALRHHRPRCQRFCGSAWRIHRTETLSVDWKGSKWLTLSVQGDQVSVWLNNKVIIDAEFSGLSDATGVGLFSKGIGGAEFQQFKSTGRERMD
jgi:hypothetical protein